VITGGAGGIGSATALVFARHGSKLLLVGRDEAGLAQSAAAVKEAGAEVATHVADVTSQTRSGLLWCAGSRAERGMRRAP
jgi:NADP-dependent 3-hydroxy acid dehydrogenase YdfG